MVQDYDSPWKEGLAKYLPRFFEFFFPAIFEDVEWRTAPRFLDKELQAVAPRLQGNKRGGRRLVDTLVELYRKSGERSWVLVHIEIQAQRVKDFEKRLLLYHTRILERYDKAVCSLAILADEHELWRPREYRQSLWGSELRFGFPACKLLDFRNQLPDLESSPNPFALLTAATLHAQSTGHSSPERRAAKERMVRGLYRAGLSGEDIREFFRLVDWILRLTPEMEKEFWREIQEWEKESGMPYISSVERIGMQIGLEKGLEQGLQQGLEQGLERGLEQGLERSRKEGLIPAILELLETRFGTIPSNLRERLDPISDLETLRSLVVASGTSGSFHDFEKILDTKLSERG